MSNLLWSEDFNYCGPPDSLTWNFVEGGTGFGNNEEQFYTSRPENAWVSEGTLKIRLLREDYENRRYTSARIHTAEKFAFTHGRAEIKAKLPRGKGVWPAIWMLGINRKEVGWPACGEIDIMEHTGKNQDKVFFSLHCKEHNHKRPESQLTVTSEIKGVSDDFHIYGVTREKGKITFHVDGKTQAVFTEENCKSWVFDEPFYFILNVACGGFFGGEPDPSVLPQQMEVEYIRVYKL